MEYNDILKRINNWDTAGFGKTKQEQKCYFLGMIASANITMGEYGYLFKTILRMARTKKK